MILHVLDLLGSDLKAYILEATRTWHVQHEFSNCRCDIVFVTHKDNFLRRGATKIKSEQFSEFGSQTETIRGEVWGFEVVAFDSGNRWTQSIKNPQKKHVILTLYMTFKEALLIIDPKILHIYDTGIL